jgi:hypothetical protein
LSPILGAPFLPVAWHAEHVLVTTSLPVRSWDCALSAAIENMHNVSTIGILRIDEPGPRTTVVGTWSLRVHPSYWVSSIRLRAILNALSTIAANVSW